MTHSYCRHWAHTVFTTKNRLPLIPRSADEQIYDFIRQQLKNMECVPLAINGMSEHIHLLYLANRKLSTSEILHQVKGSLSFWINKNNIVPHKFAWQTAYGSFSVSESAVADVKRYIDNQKSHHAKKTFQQECKELFGDSI